MIDEIYVRRRLASAGQTLYKFPKGFGLPMGYKSSLPEPMREMVIFVNDDEDGLDIILPEPDKIKFTTTTREMDEFYEVMDWLRDLGSHCAKRQIVHVARIMPVAILHHPDTEKRIYTWRRLGKKFNTSEASVRRWYCDAVSIIQRTQSLILAAHNTPRKI